MHIVTFNDHQFYSESWDEVYRNYLTELLRGGDEFVGRNGLTKSLFGCSVTVDLKLGFPLTRLRKMPMKNLFREFLFDIGFSQNVEALGPAKHFWDFLADENGELGASAYNRQWRSWPASLPGSEVPNEQLITTGTLDQLQMVIERLRETPNSRHGTVITHNPTAVSPGCPPCHPMLQWMPRPDGSLDLMVVARSNDMVVGFPLDIARYAIMTHVMARAVGMTVGRVFMPSSNSHIYENCFEAAMAMTKLTPRPECQLSLSDEWDKNLDTLELDMFSVENYDPYPSIPISVN